MEENPKVIIDTEYLLKTGLVIGDLLVSKHSSHKMLILENAQLKWYNKIALQPVNHLISLWKSNTNQVHSWSLVLWPGVKVVRDNLVIEIPETKEEYEP